MHGMEENVPEAAHGAGPASPAGAKSPVRWTRDVRNRFFDQFAASGDVARAAEAVGKTAVSAYAQRRRSASFAAMWRAVLDDSYERLEVAVVRQVLGENDTGVDVAAALLLLERRPRPRGQVAHAAPKTADENTLRARAERELLRKLKALSRQPGVKDRA